MPTTDLVRGNVGDISIVGCPLYWTSCTGGGQQSNRGDEIFNPQTKTKQRLYDEPTYENLTLGTAYSTTYATQFDKWYQANKNASNIVAVAQIGDVFYRFTNCSIVSITDYPGFDKDGQTNVTAKRLQIVIAPGARAALS